MTFLKDIPEITSLKFSIIHEKLMLKQFVKLPNYDDKKKKYDEIDHDILNDLFSVFVNFIRNPVNDHIHNLKVDYTERTKYEFLQEKDEDYFNVLAALFYYLQHSFESKKTLFETIGASNKDYHFLLENDYDIHNEKDMNELMTYFWNIKIYFRIY